MSRVLLVCPEPLGHRHPAGVGIRFLEFARALLAEQHTVTLLSPDGGSVEGTTAGPLTPQALRGASMESDVAVVQGHVANDFFAHSASIPTVVDLYDPFIVENWSYWESRGDEVFAHDHATFIKSLRRGDFFLCASEAQRLFYLGAMLACGRIAPERAVEDPTLRRLIDLAPFGVPEPRSIAPTSSHEVIFGGIYDWYSPDVAVDAVMTARGDIPDLTLTFTRHPNADLTPQSLAARTHQDVLRRGIGETVRFEPWVSYADRESFYQRFGVALLTFPPSLETDLSMRTRLFDYLWAGIPVITSSARGTDEILARYECGVVVGSLDPREYAAALRSVLGDEGRLAKMREGAQAFVRDHQWRTLLRPLLDFCASPTLDHSKNRMAAPAAEQSVVASRRSILQRIARRLRRGR